MEKPIELSGHRSGLGGVFIWSLRTTIELVAQVCPDMLSLEDVLSGPAADRQALASSGRVNGAALGMPPPRGSHAVA